MPLTLVHIVRPGILVFDIAACSPEEEREVFLEGERRAERAKLNNRFMRVMNSNLKPYEDNGVIRPADTAVVGVQHLYRDPSSPYFVEYMPAGIAQKYQSHLTIYMKRRRWRVEGIVTNNEEGGEALTDNRTVGFDVHWRVEKSKVSASQSEGEFTFYIENTLDGQYYQGQIEETEHLVHIGRMWGLIKKQGSWYTLFPGKEELKVQGAANLTALFEEYGDEFVRRVMKAMKDESAKARVPPGRPMLHQDGDEDDALDGDTGDSAEEGETAGEE